MLIHMLFGMRFSHYVPQNGSRC